MCISVGVCAYECMCLWWPEESIRSHGAGVLGGYEASELGA